LKSINSWPAAVPFAGPWLIFGLSGFLVERKCALEFEHPRHAYNIDEGKEEPKDRSIDSRTEMLRRILFE
jgi:hypothetical protein